MHCFALAPSGVPTPEARSDSSTPEDRAPDSATARAGTPRVSTREKTVLRASPLRTLGLRVSALTLPGLRMFVPDGPRFRTADSSTPGFSGPRWGSPDLRIPCPRTGAGIPRASARTPVFRTVPASGLLSSGVLASGLLCFARSGLQDSCLLLSLPPPSRRCTCTNVSHA